MQSDRLDSETVERLKEIKEVEGIKTTKKALAFVVKEYEALTEYNKELISQVQMLKLRLKMADFKK